MHHPQPFADLTPARIKAEITGAHREIWKATGVTSRLFRAPGGSWSPTVLRTAANNGMVPLDWDIDPKDWARPGAAFIKTHLLRARPGDILLCHDGGGDRRQTLRALKTVIPALQHRGLSFVTL
jgi:peptidoglycan/xylan/chitin deacetylase (PgdA/CDA1 family)